jgi:cytochrome c553
MPAAFFWGFFKMRYLSQCSLASTIVSVLVLFGGEALAQDPLAGRARAAMCTTCHGPLGLSQLPQAPHLAGQPAIYLVEQLKHFRNGKRQGEMMSVIAKPLTDQEINDLAAWYASIQISVTTK